MRRRPWRTPWHPFQSTPLIAEGRHPRATVRSSSRNCFNPRPSLLRGDTEPFGGATR